MTIAISNAPSQNPSGTVESLGNVLLNKKDSLAKRFRALFGLRGVNNLEAIETISKAFQDDSALLKHEVAYVLGQMKNPLAIPFLESVLEDKSQDPMVRHEAAEAIGAIGEKKSIPFLKKYVNDEERVVRETVVLAIAGLEDEQRNQEEDK